MAPTTLFAATVAGLVATLCQVAVAAADVSPCSLLTEARIATVLGAPVRPGAPILRGLVSQCGWTETSDSNKRVLVDILQPLGSRTPVDRFNTGKTPVNGITKTPVSGIGDEAYYSTTSGLGTVLSVRKGAAAFQVHVYGFPTETLKEMEKTLALVVLSKL